jgi:hypothetical protein
MRRYNFTLSPAYATRSAVGVTDTLVSNEEQVPALTLLSAVMLASIIFALVWLG